MRSVTRTRRTSTSVLVTGALIASLVTLGVSSPVAAAPCDQPVVSAVACENTLPGNAESEWGISGAGDASIQGFATEMSVDQGETIGFKVDTAASSYRLDVYRMGYYNGDGARLVATVTPTTILNQPACLTDPSTGLVDCGNWTQNASWSVPTDAVSGIYFARLVRTDGPSGSSHIYFVVRDDDGGSNLLMQTSDTTWQAYNEYGGNSLYTGAPAGRAYKVSYNRPLTIRDYAPEDSVFNAEYPMVRFLESNGYDVSYTSGVDTDLRGAELLEHDVFVSVGHDEYWSAAQRTNVEAARAAGVHLAFFSGNEVFWKTRWENSIDASGAPYRTLVSYKETKADAVIDPAAPIWTGTWRDPRFSPPGDGGQPENALTGQIFTVNCCEVDMVVNADDGNMRFWRNTNVAALTGNQTATVGSGIIGYEWDEDLDNGFRPAGLFRLSETTATAEVIQDYGSTYAPGEATHSMTTYRHASGALVFGAGSVQWSWGLDDNHDRGGPATSDPAAQQATVNLFADMGVQPTTLMSGLVPATQSSDTSAPVSTITFPQEGDVSPANSSITITGTAADVGGGLVGGIEVSTDDGATWRRAEGRDSWTYTFAPTVNGPLTIRARATDDSANIETPGASVSIEVGGTATCPCSIWPPSAVPDRADPDTQAVEVGVRFQASQDGQITGIRFHKNAANTGTHVGSLWADDGTNLGSVTFTGETASGWQQADFSAPIPVQAGQTYVASYHAPNARYSVSSNFFGSAVTNGPLSAVASSDGGNGVYGYTSTPAVFPNNTYQSENYWVDVVFDTGAGQPDTTAPTVVTRVPASGATGVSVAANVAATFSEAVTASTVQASVTPAAGGAALPVATTYDAGTRTVTLDPSAALSYSTDYTVSVSGAADAAGNVMAPMSWTFTSADAPGPSGCPCSIWSASAVPNRTDADTNAVEVGVKFRAAVAGTVSGIRFYKSAVNTGTHVGSLWTASGTNLGSVTFTNESSSGWQQASFATPIDIEADTTYVVSYLAPNGRYSVSSNAFVGAGVTNGPLTALETGLDGGNGVYQYTSGASAFPTNTYQSENYWVDLVFETGPPVPDTTAPTVSSRTPAAGAGSVSIGTSVSATFSEPVTEASIQIAVAPTGGSPIAAGTSYHAGSTTVTLTPSAVLTASTEYTVTLSGAADPSGNLIVSTSWTFTTAAGDATAPTIVSTTPVASATGVSASATVSATFDEPVVEASIQIAVAPTGGSALSGTTAYNPTSRTVSFQPAAALAASTEYTVTVSGASDPAGNVMTTFTLTFTTAAPSGCPCTIWPQSTVPTVSASSDASAVELGVKFRTSQAGNITSIRFYKGTGNTGVHVGNLWTLNGVNLGSVTFTGETTFGWQEASFASPIAVEADTTYVASYHAPNGRYALEGGGLAAGVTSGVLTALGSGIDGGNGVYLYGGGGFPTNSYADSNYYVDVVFGGGAADTTAPTVTSRTPSDGATDVGISTTVTATFSEPITSTTPQITVAPTGGSAVAASSSYDAVSRTLTLVPAQVLAGGTEYTVNLAGAQDPSGNTMAPTSWTFTTATASSSGCPCSIWPATTIPATPAANDTSAVEVGVKFESSQAGFVTGVRFYKGTGNTGTHVGTLWSESGTALATVTFANETASGWQEALFSGPVAVTANTTYVVSYFAPNGRYSLEGASFTNDVVNGILTAPASGSVGGNGVYAYGGGGFPTNSFNASNYFVDVVFVDDAVDTSAPTVVNRVPTSGSTSASVAAPIGATFSETVVQSTLNMTVTGPGSSAVTGVVGYDAGSRTASFTPDQDLAFSTLYSVTVSGAQDVAGNTMATDSWTFTTDGPPPPLPTDGPGGPIGVATSGSDPFSGYFAEILRAEGLNQFATFDVADLDAAELANYDTVVLGSVTVSTQQVNELTAWVQAGGNLIASRPDPKLAPLLGLNPVASTLSESYLQVDGATDAGAGIESATMQYHGTADRYTLSGATAIATLFSDATTSTTNPAVTIRSVGSNGGQAAAFTYDLARSVVYTRQGNPAWIGQERDNADGIIRSNDLYFGGSGNDWVDLNKVAIPQADEQQRLLANLIQVANRDIKPLPRFWYFPDDHKAVVVATGDDHANGGTTGRFDTYLASDPAGCSTTDWECNRFASYIYTNSPLSDSAASAYDTQDFEIGLHPSNGCQNFTSTADLRSTYANELATWTQNFPSLPSPVSNRFHCLVWSDWNSQFVVEAENDIRLDVNYYYWPGSWVNDQPGFMTGSGMPQRFAQTDGTMVDVYQAATQMTDESGQSYPFTPDTLLDRALGSEGYYGYFVANMHTDLPTTQQDTALVSSATSRGVPIVSARDVLEFVDARNQSSFQNITWTADQLGFDIAAAAGANNLTAMVPTAGPNGLVLSSIQRGANAVSYTLTTIKGLEYATFAAQSGSHTVTYSASAAPAFAADVTTSFDVTGSATFAFATDAPAASRVEFGTAPDALDSTVEQGGAAGDHEIVIDELAADETYFYRVIAESPDGAESVWPDAAEPPASFQTAPTDSLAPQVSNLSIESQTDGTALVSWITDEPADSVVAYVPSSDGIELEAYGPVASTRHEVVLTALEPGQAYDIVVSSTDASGNRSARADGQADFEAALAGVSEYMTASQRVGETQRGARVLELGEGLGAVTLQRDAEADGSFESRILDARQQVRWTAVDWEADVPENAKMVIRVRGGQSAEIDATWGEWSEVAQSGDSIDIESRFVQYRVDFQTGPGALQLPRLTSISFSHDAGFAVVEGEFAS